VVAAAAVMVGDAAGRGSRAGAVAPAAAVDGGEFGALGRITGPRANGDTLAAGASGLSLGSGAL